MTRALVVVALLTAVVDVRAAAPPALDAKGTTALDASVRAAVARGDVPGVVVLATAPDRVLYHEAFGSMNVAEGIAMTRDAIFYIASMTKPITSIAVMMLVEEGSLALDDEVAKYLPAFSSPEVIDELDLAAGTYATRPATRAISIRQLLTHTSGIGYAWSDPGLALVQKKTGAADLDLPLVHEPGERWTYGASTRVLGEVVEKISGQRLDAFLEARILGPLGMRDTFYAVPATKRSRVVTRHQRTDGGMVEMPDPTPLPATVRGDGGLYSTAPDYARFARFILNRGRIGGVRVLKEDTVGEMTRNQIGNLRVRLQPTADRSRSKSFPLGAGADVWGLGFQLAAPATADPGMRRPGSLSWGGIYNTHFWIDPEAQLAVIVLMQMLPFYDDAAMRILQGIERLVYQHLTPPPDPPGPDGPAPSPQRTTKGPRVPARTRPIRPQARPETACAAPERSAAAEARR